MGRIGSTDTLEFGYSKDGMKALDKSLDQLLYDDVKSSLKTLEKTTKEALDKCWQGKSKDLFEKDFEQRIEDIIKEIKEEYKDLQGRFADLAKFYSQQDEDLYTRVS